MSLTKYPGKTLRKHENRQSSSTLLQTTEEVWLKDDRGKSNSLSSNHIPLRKGSKNDGRTDISIHSLQNSFTMPKPQWHLSHNSLYSQGSCTACWQWGSLIRKTPKYFPKALLTKKPTIITISTKFISPLSCLVPWRSHEKTQAALSLALNSKHWVYILISEKPITVCAK